MSFDDLKLTTKSLIPLSVTSLMFLGVTALGIYRIDVLGDRYAYLTEHADAAVIRVLRSNRASTEVGYAIHSMIAYDKDTELYKTAHREFESGRSENREMLDEAAQLDPARAAAIHGFRDRIGGVIAKAAPALAIAKDVPGLQRGSRLSPHQLDQIAECIAILQGVDSELQSLTEEMRTFYLGVVADNQRIAHELERQTEQTVWSMIGIGVLAVLLGAGFSLYVSSRKIGRPITRLTDRMGDIAKGNLDAVVDGMQRRDEVGAMARALDTFKRNALELRATESRAAEERRKNEEAEARRRAEQAAADHEREAALDAIGIGLQALAEKNLTHRLSSAMPDAYRRLQNDFNAAIAQLEIGARQGRRRRRRDRLGLDPDIRGGRRPRPPHRAAGRQPRGDRRGAGGDHRHGAARAPRAPSMRAPSSARPRPRPSAAARSSAAPSTPWARSRSRPTRSARSSA